MRLAAREQRWKAFSESGKVSTQSIRRPGGQHLVGFVFVLPCLIILILMMYNPLIQNFRYSLSSVSLRTFETRFVGLDNFKRAFSQPEFELIIGNTVLWVVGTIILRFSVGFWAALTLNENIKGIRALRLLALLPWTVPSIVAANLWRWILQGDYGLLNVALSSVGLGQLAHSWLGDANTALLSVLLTYTWHEFPFVMLMLLAGMQAIPQEVYEAAKVDSASKWQIFRFITLPILKPLLVIILFLEIVSGFNTFDMLFVLTGGGPGRSSEILGLNIYRLGFNYFDLGAASALSVLLIVAAVACFIGHQHCSRRERG